MRLVAVLLLFFGVACAAVWAAALSFDAAQTTRVSYKYIASALTQSPPTGCCSRVEGPRPRIGPAIHRS